MGRKLKKIFFISGLIFSFIILLIIISSLIIYYRKSLVRGLVERYLSRQSGIKIEIAKLDYGFFPLKILAENVRLERKIESEEIRLFADQLEIRGKLRRLLKKEKPFFDSVDVKGAILEVKQKEKIRKEKAGRVDYQKNILSLSQALSYIRKVGLQESSLHFFSPFFDAHLEGVNFTLSGRGGKSEYTYSLSSKKAQVKNSGQKASFEAIFHSSGKFSLQELPFIEGDFSFEGLNLEAQEKNIFLEKIFFKMRSELDPIAETLFSPRWEIDIQPFASALGSMRIDFREGLSIFLSPRFQFRDFEKTLDFLRPYLPPQAKFLRAKGIAALEGEYRLLQSPLKKEAVVDFEFKLAPSKVSYSSPLFSLKNSLSAEFKIKGIVPDIEFRGMARIRDGNFSNQNLNIGNFSLEIPLSKKNSLLRIPLFQGNLENLNFVFQGKTLELDKVYFEGKSSFEDKNKTFSLDLNKIEALPLPRLQLLAKIDLRPEGKKYVHLESEKFDTASLQPFLSPFLPEKALAFEPAGIFDFKIEVEKFPQENSLWRFKSKLNLAQGKFHNPSFTIAAESLASEMTINGNYDLSQKILPFSLTFNLSQGESLWNAFYLNWKENPFQAVVSGEANIPLREVSNVEADISLFPLGKIKTSGRFRFARLYSLDLEISQPRSSLSSLFSFFPQKQQSSEMQFNLDGQTQSQVRLKIDQDTFSLIGQIELKDGALENKEKGFMAKGIEARFPIWYEKRKGKTAEKNESFPGKGYFLIGELRTPYFSLPRLQVNFESAKNSFLIYPFSFDFFGGAVGMGKSFLNIGEDLALTKGISSFSFTLGDLSRLPIKSSQFKLKGRLQTNLDPIEISSEVISAQDEVRINMFDGQIAVKNLKISRPFSRGRVLSCDIAFKGLNLEKMTDSIPFGRVTGIVNGEIQDFALSYGQPERFTLRLESEKRKGIPQKFSIGAVNDVAILSSGDTASVSSVKKLSPFVREFHYEKIGIFCSLKNDIFTLRGTIKEKGTEYLVKKSWLFGISVINRDPQGKISFKEMLGRLKRIGSSRKDEGK